MRRSHYRPISSSAIWRIAQRADRDAESRPHGGSRVAVSRAGTAPQTPEGAIEVEWAWVQQQWTEWVATLADADLERVIDYKDMRGNAHRSSVEEIVMHVVNHGTLHRGQVMAMMRQLGVAPPPTDLIYFYREQANA